MLVAVSAPALAQSALPPPPLPPPRDEPVPVEALDSFVHVGWDGEATVGRARESVSRRDFFMLVGRADLAAKSDANARARLAFSLAAGGAGLATAVGVAVLWATTPSEATPTCEANVVTYNEVCVPRRRAHEVATTSVLAGGTLITAALVAVALFKDPQVVTTAEAEALAGQHNAARLRRARSPVGLVPWVSPAGGGVALTWSLP